MQVEAFALVTVLSFGLSAVLVRKGLSESMVVIATQGGLVSVISAIIGASPLFGLLISVAFLRDVERITLRTKAGCPIIVAGITVITLL